jgi:PiT family inorganic phosphate transporter
VVLAAFGNVLGPLLLGTAVANTIAGIVTVPSNEVIPVVGAALSSAVTWTGITWWRGLPSSSGHALLGGLVGALAAGGANAVNWGGFDGITRSGCSVSRPCSRSPRPGVHRGSHR